MVWQGCETHGNSTALTSSTTAEDSFAGLAMGGFIADALAMPVHWYYDRSAICRRHQNRRLTSTSSNPSTRLGKAIRGLDSRRRRRSPISGTPPELWDQSNDYAWKAPELDLGDGRTLVMEYTE
jgi:hypothetical protein